MKKLLLLCCFLLVGCGDDPVNNMDIIQVTLPVETTVEVKNNTIEEDMSTRDTVPNSNASGDETLNVEVVGDSDLLTKTASDRFEEMTKDEVLWLQESLKIAGFYTSRDGDFGNKSKVALNEFWTSNGLADTSSYQKTVDTLKVYRDQRLAPNYKTDSVLLNKNYYLPSYFVPDNLREVLVNKNKAIELQGHVADSVEAMFADAMADGIVIYLASGYRSYDYQEGIFSRRVANKGFAEAQTVVAIPGQSEHQTGLTIDVTSEKMGFALSQSFDQDPVFEWMMDNCYKYGFVLRYLKAREDETGYIYEPWHYRYIGDVEAARYIMEKQMILEEYLTD